uniref:Oxidoreductase domain-containing protein n=1 Tax=uncultured marine group II/III euryarchaeote KM3_185_F09 TaxID=1457950 RepID=A0A075GP66_9EURY|nr:oxidoreductase domain-containing protein [uncultured marine group II/III euryarchaeote KM3_185_F09]
MNSESDLSQTGIGLSALTAVLVGLGHRSVGYASYSDDHPDELQVVGLAEPNPERLARYALKWGVSAERCFSSAAELAAAPKFADVAINGTMDDIHVETTIPLLEAGYDVLLEKPIARGAAELRALAAAAERTGRKVVICHVLRHAPYYVAIKERIAAGEIGEIMHIHSTENVSYHHMAVGFVRGKWNRREVNPMMLAKCCHDLDLLCWFKSGTEPTQVASFGGCHFFTEQNAPKGAGTHCHDCEIERDCQYSAHRHHLNNDWWPFYAFSGEATYEAGDAAPDVAGESFSEEEMAESRRAHLESSDYSRCVWRCDNDVVDRQSVIVEFADGCVATHDMVTNSARATRRLQITGTKGEIEGDMISGRIVIRKPAATDGEEWAEEVITIGEGEDMHGGGDLRLVADFVKVVRGEPHSLSTTELSDSMNSHLIAYAADKAMQSSTVVTLDDMR